ncbi:4-hydroxy-tetrahydrodipicolinate synthase [Lacticaseibacillus zhaodongensis]|uniref:4-hydroxy-tetrahydrodipicolinate synthase n=1 Tax=Lacticaseibacillus zhaodongensis TaxID=2668065 RepID=UPI0012D2BCEA|nr:4-hydroxy-tetrahydrodipicolinate synthase [Lacticaseibacillus zhaodongensis]
MYENVQIMTAIITPFNTNGDVDYPALDNLVERLLKEGTQGFIVAGTTGESPTLTEDEKIALFQYFATHVHGRALVIANVGSNNTAASVKLAREASEIKGVNGLLAVTPYYNKPSHAGMIAHFTEIADASAVPVMLYNIPGRSVVGLTNESLLKLADHPNINAVKQVTTPADIKYITAHAPADFTVFTGEDAQMLDAVRAGAAGVISVASHFYGKQMRACLDAEAAGDTAKADALMAALKPKMQALFMFPSPAPTKMYLARRGEINGRMRLPMIPLTDDEAEQVVSILEAE